MSDIVMQFVEWAVLLVGFLATFLALEFVLRTSTERLTTRRQVTAR